MECHRCLWALRSIHKSWGFWVPILKSAYILFYFSLIATLLLKQVIFPNVVRSMVKVRFATVWIAQNVAKDLLQFQLIIYCILIYFHIQLSDSLLELPRIRVHNYIIEAYF